MKMLLNSKEHTYTVINSIRYYRQSFIDNLKTAKASETITAHDLNLIIQINEKEIDKCNAVLDLLEVA